MKGIIIGFGNMGQNHYQRYQKLRADIVAIIDTDLHKREIAQTLGLPGYETLEKFLLENQMEDIHFIDICLPTDLHFSCIQQVIKQSQKPHIPIIIEKPVVRTTSEANELEILAQAHPGIIFVAEVEHYNARLMDFLKDTDPAHIKISRMVNKSYFLDGTDQWSLNASRSGGPILDLMIHDFSILDSIFGKATLIKGDFKKVTYQCIDEATVILEFPGGFEAEVTGSWLSKNSNPIVWTVDIVEKNGSVKHLTIDDYVIRGSSYDDNDAFYLEIKAFLNAVQTNTMPVHRLEDYLRVVKLSNNIIALAAQNDMQYDPVFFRKTDTSAEQPDLVCASSCVGK